VSFVPWRPELGRVFLGTYALDCETTLIDDDSRWLTPAYVLGAACDGQRGYFIQRQHVAAFLEAHVGVPVIFHNAPFDLAVLKLVAPQVDPYEAVDRNQVWDIQLLHRLLVLAEEGHTAGGTGESTLGTCLRRYLGVELPKELTDSHGDQVRLSYAKWLNRPPGEIERIYLEYLAKDALATFLVHGVLQQRLEAIRERAVGAFGYVSPEWFDEQRRLWGPQTHHIQLRGAIVLREITANGLHLDVERCDELAHELATVVESKRELLRQHGYLPGEKGSGKALQAILRGLAARHPELDLPRTPKGNKFATSADALANAARIDPFVATLLEYQGVQKLQSCFLKKMRRRVLHPSFDVLKVTGRTSSSGEINAQNLPRDDRIRGCIVAAPGHILLAADYSTIELVCLAEACERQFGWQSEMARRINAGEDLHRELTARVLGIPASEASDEDRNQAKPINFGKPGGMGNATLQKYALVSYKVQLDEDQVQQLSATWLEMFPEMSKFLADNLAARNIAQDLWLTPADFAEQTGIQSFLRHPDNQGREHEPHPILGYMCLKVLREPCPTTNQGRAYTQPELDYFWSKVQGRVASYPESHRAAVEACQPFIALHRAIKGHYDVGSVITLTGRLRARARYTARRNTIFQGLAADGAKEALWKLWRSGYRLGNFVHDEIAVEVLQQADIPEHEANVRRIMIEGMQEVVHNVRIEVKVRSGRSWSKSETTPATAVVS
jgi:hypothetical protein